MFCCLALMKLMDRFQGEVSTLSSIYRHTCLIALDFSSTQNRFAAALILSIGRCFTCFMPSFEKVS